MNCTKFTLPSFGKMLATLTMAICVAEFAAFAGEDEIAAAKESSSVFELDATVLVDAFKDSVITSSKCRTLVRNFESAVSNANAVAASKRSELKKTIKDGLKSKLKKAQSSGNLEMALAYKEALESVDGEIKGDSAAIESIRSFQERQSEQIDKELKSAGIAAGRKLHFGLDSLKQEFTRQGDLETAKKIADYQQKIEAWAKSLQFSSPQVNEDTIVNRRPEPAVHQSTNSSKSLEPEAKIITIDARSKLGTPIGQVKAGDIVEISYLDGIWNVWRSQPDESPDEGKLASTWGSQLRAVLVESDDPTIKLATIPSGTASKPFIYHVTRNARRGVSIRINDSGNFGDNAGSVRYSVRVIPAGGGEPTPAAAVGGNRSPASVARIYTISSKEREGTFIGRANVGDTIEIQYVSGKWHFCEGQTVQNPDAIGIDGRCRCLLVQRGGEKLVLAEVPANTRDKPFKYMVEEGSDEGFSLRIRTFWDAGRSQGSVRYSVRVIPSAGDSRHPSNEPPSPRRLRSSIRPVPHSKSEARIVTINANDIYGTTIVESANTGDQIELQYLDGKWRAGTSGVILEESPDADILVHDENSAVIAQNDLSRRGLKNVAKLPGGTATKPFVFSVNEPGKFVLRINDVLNPRLFADNAGSVRYLVRVIPAEGGESTPDAAAGNSRPSASSGLSNQVLSGTQSEVSVTLRKTSTPHVVREQYLVPQGKELIVEAGATIIFEKEASLYCEGTLKMNGTKFAPIICRGHMPKVGYWNGITVKTSDSEISSLKVRDAKTGLNCFDASPMIRNSIFCKNEVGVNLHNCNGFFEDCLFDDNDKNGLHCDYAGHNKASFKQCTFSNNRKWGIDCGYYGSPQLDSCLITKNSPAGIHTYLYGCEVRANECIIMDNKGYDVEHNASPKLNFQRNYWGPSVTRLLQQRGDGANLPNIKDGRDSGGGNIVDVAEFLIAPPKDCGSTVKW